jgi:hypothetical protein
VIDELPMVGVAAGIANADYHDNGARVRKVPIRIGGVRIWRIWRMIALSETFVARRSCGQIRRQTIFRRHSRAEDCLDYQIDGRISVTAKIPKDKVWALTYGSPTDLPSGTTTSVAPFSG